MPIDTQPPDSPGWWFARLLGELYARHRRLNRLDAYFRGECDLPEGAENHKEAYRAFQRKARTNFAELVVEAPRERMVPVGFRVGGQADTNGDKKCWRIWQANQLDADSALVHRASLAMGDSYVIVGPTDPDIGAPLITPEDPRQVVTAHDPRRRRKTIAALKVFVDDVVGVEKAYLYLPGIVYQAYKDLPRESASPSPPNVLTTPTLATATRPNLNGWEWEDDTPDELGFDIVPVVRFANRADLFHESMGEFESSVDVLDRINHMLLQRLVIATVQAFRQRAIKGVPPTGPNGEAVDYNGLFRADPGALWLLPPDSEMWESGQVDLNGILQAVRHDIQDLAATTRTPMSYLMPDSANQSAEGAAAARERLVFKTQDRIDQASESWEQVMGLALMFAGDRRRAAVSDMQMIWQAPDASSLAERADAFGKLSAEKLPFETALRVVMQFTPQQIERTLADQAAEKAAASPPPGPPSPDGQATTPGQQAAPPSPATGQPPAAP